MKIFLIPIFVCFLQIAFAPESYSRGSTTSDFNTNEIESSIDAQSAIASSEGDANPLVESFPLKSGNIDENGMLYSDSDISASLPVLTEDNLRLLQNSGDLVLRVREGFLKSAVDFYLGLTIDERLHTQTINSIIPGEISFPIEYGKFKIDASLTDLKVLHISRPIAYSVELTYDGLWIDLQGVSLSISSRLKAVNNGLFGGKLDGVAHASCKTVSARVLLVPKTFLAEDGSRAITIDIPEAGFEFVDKIELQTKFEKETSWALKTFHSFLGMTLNKVRNGPLAESLSYLLKEEVPKILAPILTHLGTLIRFRTDEAFLAKFGLNLDLISNFETINSRFFHEQTRNLTRGRYSFQFDTGVRFKVDDSHINIDQDMKAWFQSPIPISFPVGEDKSTPVENLITHPLYVPSKESQNVLDCIGQYCRKLLGKGEPALVSYKSERWARSQKSTTKERKNWWTRFVEWWNSLFKKSSS